MPTERRERAIEREKGRRPVGRPGHGDAAPASHHDRPGTPTTSRRPAGPKGTRKFEARGVRMEGFARARVSGPRGCEIERFLSSGHSHSREREREALPLTVTADWEVSSEKSTGGEDQSTVGEEQRADVDLPSLEDSTKNFNGRHSVGERARVEHSEVPVMRSSGHCHSRETEREKLSLTVSADLEISGEKSPGGEERLAVGEEQYADFYVLPLEDSTKNCNGRDRVGKRARIEHPEVLVVSFKVPVSLECKGCESVIAKGVRINAEKKLVGNYYGMKIWGFTVKCAYCGQKIVMERVSGDHKYFVIKGAREKTGKHQGKEKTGKHQGKGQPGYPVIPGRAFYNHGFTLLAMIDVKARDEFLKTHGH